MQKIAIYSLSLVVVGYLGYQAYILNSERSTIVGELDVLTSEEQALMDENERLGVNLEYLSDPHNLEKELRARFNYRSPNETLIIVVPEEEEEEADVVITVEQ